jgi:hypothetical protein
MEMEADEKMLGGGRQFSLLEEAKGMQIVFECHTHNPAKLMFREVYTK